jgi:hypothetical protein
MIESGAFHHMDFVNRTRDTHTVPTKNNQIRMLLLMVWKHSICGASAQFAECDFHRITGMLHCRPWAPQHLAVDADTALDGDRRCWVNVLDASGPSPFTSATRPICGGCRISKSKVTYRYADDMLFATAWNAKR